MDEHPGLDGIAIIDGLLHDDGYQEEPGQDDLLPVHVLHDDPLIDKIGNEKLDHHHAQMAGINPNPNSFMNIQVR